jgi:hypothetical protein
MKTLRLSGAQVKLWLSERAFAYKININRDVLLMFQKAVCGNIKDSLELFGPHLQDADIYRRIKIMIVFQLYVKVYAVPKGNHYVQKIKTLKSSPLYAMRFKLTN